MKRRGTPATAAGRAYRVARESSAMAPPAPPETTDADHKHLHVRLADGRTSVYDLVTEYLQAAGKAPDWYWRTAGRLEGSEPDDLEELLSSAFEAGAYIVHDHPEDVKFQWVSEEECERERRVEERGEQRDESRRERSSLSHYA